MLLSGFTMARNAFKLHFPIKASICSILPIVDEFIVALGEGDEDDFTLQEILSIQDPKIKIIHRCWDEALFKAGKIFAHETDFALAQCNGDWCIYLQADEVIHEGDLNTIQQYCEFYHSNLAVDGFLFPYYNFWGDYGHIINAHNIYRKEIRLVRNKIGCYSYNDAVSFRKGNNEKLRVIDIPAHIYHYGYVRPPRLMNEKSREMENFYKGSGNENQFPDKAAFDYGPIGGLPLFKGSHPGAMYSWIESFDWGRELNYQKWKPGDGVIRDQHKLKYRLLTWVENNLLQERTLFGLKNYRRLNKKKIASGWHDNKSSSPFPESKRAPYPTPSSGVLS